MVLSALVTIGRVVGSILLLVVLGYTCFLIANHSETNGSDNDTQE